MDKIINRPTLRNNVVIGFDTISIPFKKLVKMPDSCYDEESIDELTPYNWKNMLVQYNCKEQNYTIISGVSIYNALIKQKDTYGNLICDENTVVPCNLVSNTLFMRILENNQEKLNRKNKEEKERQEKERQEKERQEKERQEVNSKIENITARKKLCESNHKFKFKFSNVRKIGDNDADIEAILVREEIKSTMRVFYPESNYSEEMVWDGKHVVGDTLEDGGKVVDISQRSPARSYNSFPISFDELREMLWTYKGLDLCKDIDYSPRHKQRVK